MKTEQEILNTKPSTTIGLDSFYGYQTVINAMREHSDQFKPKWNDFAEKGVNDPEYGEFVVVLYPPEQMSLPELVTWGVDEIEIIDGSQWLSITKLLEP